MYKTCHTEESSRRQRLLEQGLLAAMEKQPYEKITLTELCRRLNVPRKSFYRYFPNREDCLLALMDHTLSDCNSVALRGWDGSQELTREDLLRFFTYWQEHTAFLNAVRDNGLGYLLLDRTTVIVDKMKENQQSGDFARDQVEYFIAHGLMATVLRWHGLGFQSSPEEMAGEFARVLRLKDVTITRLLL